jgi:hypothetical protein
VIDSVEKVAEMVLYEGYLLYPYRPSALKNQMRWTFGGVYPRQYSEATGGDDPWMMQTQCLVAGDSHASVDIKVRFLQVVDRTVAATVNGTLETVDSLRVNGRVYRPWEEAIEREVVGSLHIDELVDHPHHMEFVIDAGRSEEPLKDMRGQSVGAIVRDWQAVNGVVEASATHLGGDCFRVTVRIINETPYAETDRSGAVHHSFLSTHTILRVWRGQFVSLLEPSPEYQDAARMCENVKTWPVLAGEPGDRQTILSSPIILYDYPAVSPESPGDLFDGTEIDELLRFSILTLTDDEKQEMRESDERGREILERTEALTPEQLMKLHASVRSVQTMRRPAE